MSNNLLGNVIDVNEFKKKLNNNFFGTLDKVFDELNNIIINYHRENDNKIDELFSFIDESIFECDDYKLKFLVSRCVELKGTIKKKRKKFLAKIDSILDNVDYENSNEYRFNMESFLNYLIHEDKNLARLKVFLNNLGKSFFSSTFYDNIVSSVLCCFDINNDNDKNYYYKVSIMLFDKMSNTLLSKCRSKYLSILDNISFPSEYVDDLKKILNNQALDSSILASRFNISFDFPYEYNDFGIILNDLDVPSLKQPAITIDNEHTVKRDDAIYFKKNRDCTYTLYAHVGYVPSLISYDSVINKVARERGKNVSFLNRIVPIYPCDMVLDNFSLNKGVFKPTVTYSLKVSKDFKIIPGTLKITKTNVKVTDNYSYSGINNVVRGNYDNEFGEMLKYLTILTMNNVDNFDLDVERLLGDKLFYKQFLVDNGNRNIAQEMIQYIMKQVNYNSAKYFRDRGIPCLYKWASTDTYGLNELREEIAKNSIVQKNKKIINDLNCTFLEVKLSEVPRRFFEWECYSSFTSPLRKYSSSYNQFMMDKFVFTKNLDSDLREEWHNNTRVLAEELNYRKKLRREMEIVDKKLSRIRKKV